MNGFQVKCQLVNRYFIVFVGVSKIVIDTRIFPDEFCITYKKDQEQDYYLIRFYKRKQR